MNRPESKVLVDVAVQSLSETGLKPEKVRGRGRSNIWTIQENGTRKFLSIRTTRDRWIAFQPLPGRKWQTLDNMDIVIVAAVDDPDTPAEILVYRFDAAEVRRRFDESYDARIRNGNKVPFGCGMWVCLDNTGRSHAAESVGEGIATVHEPIRRFPLEELMAATLSAAPKGGTADRQDTIGKIKDDARRRTAALLGVHVDQVRLDFRIEDR